MNHDPSSRPLRKVRNRIKEHRRVRPCDLVPHELNFRLHPERQRAALDALYREVGFARSLLAFEMPDGRLKLIDGHLRRDIHLEMEVDVEILDVNEEEARALLLSLDPLAELALVQEQIHQRLVDLTPTKSLELESLWSEAEQTIASALEDKKKEERNVAYEPKFLVLITCADEEQQVELLERFGAEGFVCKAVVG